MILSLQLLTFLVILKTGESFVVHQSSPSPPPDITTRMRTPSFSSSSSSSSLSYARHSNTEDPEEMRKEIAALREEALQKLHVLQERIDNVELVEVEEEEEEKVQHDETSTTATATITSAATALDHHVEEASFPKSGDEVILDFMERERAALEETNSMVGSETSLASDSATITSTETSSTLTTSSASSPDAVPTQAEALRRLDDTRWRVMLNIGREPGTWMPNEWGASGDRLHLHLELEFSSDALLMDEGEGEEDVKGKKGKHGNKHKKNLNYPGDDFLNGRSYTKVLKVVQNEASMSPTMTEGARKVRVHNGAWRVAPFEGPMGTTVLRFYVELEEQASHGDSDVWCPAGRVYCTCGYFPMYHDPITGLVSTCSLPSTIGSSKNKNKEDAVVLPVSCLKAALKEEQEQIASYYEALARANHEDPAIFSWDKLKRSSQMMKLKQDATKLAHKRHELNIREPDKNVLRLSQDQQVGITREGGVCCKVHKGLAVEYHMLGKFEIASMKNRDHKDYRELLMP
ncbi:unnamed protein product [Cylindrotheca closterium]|uniref:Uncharacterized protein n=1 Tax=Cylindrotheca closterium TaxID=2856 RepID=A0AAD2FM15_9STRA|nr:unnamed protein product [Cylindrotheca closterium]